MRTKITRDRSQKKAKPNEVPGKIVQESNFESDEQQQKTMTKTTMMMYRTRIK